MNALVEVRTPNGVALVKPAAVTAVCQIGDKAGEAISAIHAGGLVILASGAASEIAATLSGATPLAFETQSGFELWLRSEVTQEGGEGAWVDDLQSSFREYCIAESLPTLNSRQFTGLLRGYASIIRKRPPYQTTANANFVPGWSLKATEA